MDGTTLSDKILLDDWFDWESDNTPVESLENKTVFASGCNTCPSEEGYLKKGNFLGEFLTEADKDKARKNLGIENLEVDVTSEDVDYTNSSDPNITNVKEALDKLFYVDLAINSFTVSPSEAETGDTVTSLTYNWRYNKDIKSQSFDDEVLNNAVRTKTINGQFKTNISKSLKASDGTLEKTSTATLTFKDGRYYGVSASDPTTEEIISNFTRNLNLNKGGSFTVNAGSGQYIYLLVPYSMNGISFSVGGFEGGFEKINDNYQFTRYPGTTVRCVLFRSDNPSLGNTTVTIK